MDNAEFVRWIAYNLDESRRQQLAEMKAKRRG